MLAGRYQLDTPLGSGGTATVWRALDLEQRRIVAVKVLPHAGGSVRLRARLRAEAEVMATLHHPNVLRVFGLGTDGAVDWIAMEHCPGGALADRLQRSGPLPPRIATTLTIDVLEALSFAHERGVVHRDVKPGNILLGADERARLCDFGIARVAGKAYHQTRTGAALGSWAYMAPEQRVDAHSVGPRADVYAVGATLYTLLTDATPTDLYLANDASPRWADVPIALRPILQRATAASPTNRHRDTNALSRDLRRLLSRLSTQPPPRRKHHPGDATWSETVDVSESEAPIVPRLPRLEFPTPVSEPREVTFEVKQRPTAPPSRTFEPIFGDPASVIRGQRARLLFAGVLAVMFASGVAHRLQQADWRSPPRPSREPVPIETITPRDSDVPAVRPEGRWRGLWNEHLADLMILSHGGVVMGHMDLTLPGEHRVSLPLHGIFDPTTNHLSLGDAGKHPNAADYSLQLEPHGNLLRGEYRLRRTGEVAPVLLVRMQ